MSLPAFAKAMDAILRGVDFETVKRDGVRLITVELGAGVPGYLEHIERFQKRLDELAPKRQARAAGEAL